MSYFRQALIQTAAYLLLAALVSGCVAKTWTNTPEGPFWKFDPNDKKSVRKVTSTEISWDEFVDEVVPKLRAAEHKLKRLEVLRVIGRPFPKPTSRRVDSSGVVEGWLYIDGELVDEEYLVRNKDEQFKNFYMFALGYDHDGVLRKFDTNFETIATISKTWSTKQAMIFAASVGGGIIVSYAFTAFMKSMLKDVADHVNRNMQKLIPQAEDAIGRGIKGGMDGAIPNSFSIGGVDGVMPNSFSIPGAAEFGTIDWKQFRLDIPSQKIKVR